MHPNASTIELAHLYSILKPHRVNIEKDIPIHIVFVRRTELCRDIGRRPPPTVFITFFYVADLYSMISRDGARQVLQQFSCQHARNGRINNMTGLILNTNCFVFDATICMLKWEQPLIEHQKFHNEPDAQYSDDVFMTINLPIDQMNILLDRANEKGENIRISRSIGSTLVFLDVCVSNN